MSQFLNIIKVFRATCDTFRVNGDTFKGQVLCQGFLGK